MDATPDLLLSSIADQLRSARQIMVAFSGGMDSTVLLHAVVSGFSNERVTAIHVNHGLSPSAPVWQEHCNDVCAAMGVKFIAREVEVSAEGEGREQAARRARYRVFEALLGEGGVILMAHHLDDQVETVLYRLLRGSGPKGLAGIPARRPLGSGTLLRPLLDVPRSALETYASQYALSWIEDESNNWVDVDRNYLRHEVAPRLADRWPDYRRRIARSGEQCLSASTALDELALQDLGVVDERKETLGFSLALDQFILLSIDRRKNVLRLWAARRQYGPLGHTTVDEVLNTLIPAREDGNPVVAWRNGEFRRFRNRLYLLPPQESLEIDSAGVYLPTTFSPDVIPLPDGTSLWLEPGDGKSALAVKPGEKGFVTFRKGGEYCHPANRAGGAPLKKLFNEYGVETWLRDRVPLIFLNDELVAVADLFVCREYCCDEGERGVTFRWQFPDG